jgi:hypothetical protein
VEHSGAVLEFELRALGLKAITLPHEPHRPHFSSGTLTCHMEVLLTLKAGTVTGSGTQPPLLC